MRRVLVAAIVVALVGVAQLAAALGGPVCCACLPAGGAQTSGTNRTAIDAAFCAQAPPANPALLADQCNAMPDHGLSCIPDVGPESCVRELALAGVRCPGAGVPAAGSSTLLALTVVLAAAGAFILRRRRA